MSAPRKILPPRPAAGFNWLRSPDHWALVCDALAPVARHAFTARPWRLGSSSSVEAWEEVAAAVGAAPANLCRARQVHGADVLVQRAPTPFSADCRGDIIVGNAAGMALAIQTADCVPLLLADTRTGAVAAAHAGWRGTSLGVAGAAVEAMTREFGCNPEDLVAAAGPSIGPCCYEVGPDVRQQFAREGFTVEDLSRWFAPSASDLTGNPPMARAAGHAPADSLFLDLWTATRDQLEAAGVRRDRIFVSDLCTASHPSVFCSYRRDGTDAGRLAAVIRFRRLKPQRSQRTRRKTIAVSSVPTVVLVAMAAL